MQYKIQKKRNIHCSHCNKLIRSRTDLAVALDGIWMLRYIAPYHKTCFNKVHGKFQNQYKKTKDSTVNSGWSTGMAILAALNIPLVLLLIPTGAFQSKPRYSHYSTPPTEYGYILLIVLIVIVIYRICSWYAYERHLPKYFDTDKRKKISSIRED